MASPLEGSSRCDAYVMLTKEAGRNRKMRSGAGHGIVHLGTISLSRICSEAPFRAGLLRRCGLCAKRTQYIPRITIIDQARNEGHSNGQNVAKRLHV